MAAKIFTSDADLFEQSEMFMDAVTEMARVDAQRLAHIDEGEWSIVVLGVNPIRSLEEFKPLGRIPFGIAMSEIAADSVLEQGKKKAALRVRRRSPPPEQIVILDRKNVGSLEYAGQFVHCF